MLAFVFMFLLVVGIRLSRETLVCAAEFVNLLGKNYGDPGLPNRHNPPLGFTNEIQRNASYTFGISSAVVLLIRCQR